MPRISRILIVGLLLAPYLLVLLLEKNWSLPASQELGWALWDSTAQSLLSSAASLGFGLLGAVGLLRIQRGRHICEWLLVFPNFLPPLFVILAGLNLIQPFPMGMTGVVLLHTMMNAGMAAVVIEKTLAAQVGGMAELAWIEGSTRWNFFRRGVLGALKVELLGLGFWIFTICFTSFAIPLVVGGGKLTTLDLLLYEKIRIEGSWSQAAGLALLQTVFVLGFGLFLPSRSLQRPLIQRSLQWLAVPWGLGPVLIFSLLLVLGLMSGLATGIQQWSQMVGIGPLLLRATLGTLFVGILVGGLCWMGLTAVALGWPHRKFKLFLFGYTAPSAVLTAFGLMMLALHLRIQDPWNRLILVALGVAIPLIPSLFRMRWGSTLESLGGQITVARTLGASPELIYRKVLSPQVQGARGFLSGVAAFWAVGEFALTGLVAGNDSTLALVVQGLTGSYRLEMATALLWWLLFIGGLCYFLFRGVRRVEN